MTAPGGKIDLDSIMVNDMTLRQFMDASPTMRMTLRPTATEVSQQVPDCYRTVAIYST